MFYLSCTSKPVTGFADANVEAQFPDANLTHRTLRLVLDLWPDALGLQITIPIR